VLDKGQQWPQRQAYIDSKSEKENPWSRSLTRIFPTAASRIAMHDLQCTRCSSTSSSNAASRGFWAAMNGSLELWAALTLIFKCTYKLAAPRKVFFFGQHLSRDY
jgi:hypothetical protein